jgi:hypothetical protein
MKILLIAILVVFAILALRVMRKPATKAGKPTSARSVKKVAAATAGSAPGPGDYRSSSIDYGSGACEAVRALDGKRLLVGEVARLPLADCTSPNCSCKFVHHDDRRESHEDKRAISGLSTELYAASGKPERRKRKGRRKSDFK